MEHTGTKFVSDALASVLTPLGFGGLLPPCRTGESKVATVIDCPAPAKSKAPAKKGSAPTMASLKAKVDRAAKQGPDRPDIGALSHAERNKRLFGS